MTKKIITDAGLKEGFDLTISCNPIIKLLYMQVKKLEFDILFTCVRNMAI